MIRGRKGMISIVDASVFIVIIGLIAAGMFAYSSAAIEKEPLAKEMYDAFFAIELHSSDLFDDPDTRNVRICDLMAAYMTTGEGSVKEYAEDILRSIIPPVYGYLFVFEYGGSVMTIGNGGNVLSSSYHGEKRIINGNTMRASLSLY
ncbi:MAG: hypothetical protein FWD92_06400 [Methanomassiliicoccaceae archaeon]|nr:hypothetical protein [Methanomassiliicoccaceae archaeon]